MCLQGFGLLLGVITMNPKTAQTLASVVLMAMVLTGGFFVTQLPSWCVQHLEHGVLGILACHACFGLWLTTHPRMSAWCFRAW
jgi:hypothetical protein